MPMNIDDFQTFCTKKKGSELCFPFGDDHMVFKVGNKMFALAPLNPFNRINLKCEPAKALQLRAMHTSVIPGWHMNKKHWNTILLDEHPLSNKAIYAMIDDSYNLVLHSLSKEVRNTIERM